MAGLTRHLLKIEYCLSGDCGSSLRYARNDTTLSRQLQAFKATSSFYFYSHLLIVTLLEISEEL